MKKTGGREKGHDDGGGRVRVSRSGVFLITLFVYLSLGYAPFSGLFHFSAQQWEVELKIGRMKQLWPGRGIASAGLGNMMTRGKRF